MGSCYVLDRRWRYGVEKGSFATLVGHWRAGHRMASCCGERDALLLFKFIGQPRFDEIGCRARRSASPSGCRRPRLHCPSDPVSRSAQMAYDRSRSSTRTGSSRTRKPVAWWMAEVRYYGQYVAVADVASAFLNCPTRRLIPIFGFSFSAFS